MIEEETPYIPKDLTECLTELEKLLGKDEIESLRKKNEEDLPGYQFDLARWLRGRWGLWQGSRLAEFFKSGGIFHPDDMSAIILIAFHRYLNKRDINITEVVQSFWDYWKNYDGEVSDWDRKYLAVIKRRLR
jgi:hypothetical protein